MGQIRTMQDLRGFAARRFKAIVLLTLIGMALAQTYARAMPRHFTASAVLQIADAQELPALERYLTRRDALIAMIERHGLFAGAAPASDAARAAALRRAIVFQPLAADGQAGLSGLVISARWSEGEKAARIANDLAQALVDRSAQLQREGAQADLARTRAEADEGLAEIAGIVAERALFQTANADLLPVVTAARRAEVMALETDLRLAKAALAAPKGEAGDNRAALRTRVSGMEARRQELLDAIAMAVPVEQALAEIDRRLTRAEGRHDLALDRMRTAGEAAGSGSAGLALIERALAPVTALGASPRQVVIIGSLASLLAAAVLLLVVEHLTPIVRSGAQLERQLSIRPIVAIPDLRRPAPRRAMGAALRAVDDPQRPILGMPRFAVVSVLLTAGLLALAQALG